MGDTDSPDLMDVRALLDDALLSLRAIDDPDTPLEEVRSYLSLGLAAVYAGCRDAADHPTVRESAARALSFCRETLAALQKAPIDAPSVETTLRFVAQALGALSQPDIAPPVPGLSIPIDRPRPPLAASVGVPRLHDVQRGPLHPTVPLRERDLVRLPEVDPTEGPPGGVPRINTIAELEAWAASQDAEAIDAPAPPPILPPPEDPPLERAMTSLIGCAVPEGTLIYGRASGFFEDIATMSSMRKADAGDVWHELAPVEHRMLARVDAILACGVWILPRLIQLLEDRPVPDPEMLWAALFMLGCIEGDDTRDQMVRLIRITPLDDDELFDAVADVLSVVPHRGIEGVLRGWLVSDDPYSTALAAHVLGRRRATMVQTLLPLLGHAHPRVLEETARALETVPGELHETDLRDVIRHADPRVFAAGAECAVVRGFRSGVTEAEYRLRRGDKLPRAALLVALTSDEEALDLVFSLAATAPSHEVFEALGWLGATSIVPFLLGRLGDGEVSAVTALQRLTGASLTEEDPYRHFAEEARPFSRAHFVAPPFEPFLSEDAAVWGAFWEEHGPNAVEHTRYRFGHAWTTEDNLYEMVEMPASTRCRRLAYLELCARAGGGFPFDPNAFVPHQWTAIRRWQEYLGESHSRAPRGAWASRLTA